MAVKSLALALKKVKLPKVAYHLDDNDRITKITDLEMSESTNKRRCDCTVVKAQESVADEAELTTHVNKLEVSLSDCYPTLPAALEALRMQVMGRDKTKFDRATPSAHDSISQQLRFLKQHPELVLARVKAKEDVESELSIETLNQTHYRLCCGGGLNTIRKIVIDKKFPELAKADDDADED